MTQPDAGYGFELCAADDTKRTHFHCAKHGCWYPAFDGKQGRDCLESHGPAKHWRKPKELPAEFRDEWRVIGGDEVLTEQDMCISDGELKDQSWFKYLNRQWTPNQVKNYPQPSPEFFIRRKSQPVSAVESGAEFGRWISVKERLPEDGSKCLACGANSGCVWSIGSVFTDGSCWRTGEITHWMPLPNPPAPEKTAAELAWDEHRAKHPNEGFGADERDAFLAGYAKGAAK